MSTERTRSSVENFGMCTKFLDESNLDETSLEKSLSIKRKIPSDDTKPNQELQDLINQFKKSCLENKESRANLMGLRGLTEKISRTMPEQFAFSLKKIFDILRAGFVLGNLDIDNSDINQVVEHIVTSVIDSGLTKKQMNSVLKAFDKELNMCQCKMKDSIDDVTKERLQSYIDQLSLDKNKISQFIEDAFSKNMSYKMDGENQPAFKPESEEDKEAREQEWEDELETMHDELVEAATILMISNLVTTISEGFGDTDVTDMVNKNLYKFDPETIDSITDFTITVPSIIDRDKFKDALEDYKAQIKQEHNFSMEDYIKLDCINENITKLKSDERPIYNTTSSPNAVIAYLYWMEQLMRLNSDSDIINENMKFSNVLKLAVLNIKRKAINLSDKEKQAANTMDAAMNSMIKSMDRQMSPAERERVVRGSILPSASKCVKLAIVLGLAWLVHPAIAIITAIGSFVCISKSNYKERQLALDEIEIELKMCERYIRIYEDRGEMDKLRQCEMIYRNLQRQHQRIKYKMSIDTKHADVSKLPLPTGND